MASIPDNSALRAALRARSDKYRGKIPGSDLVKKFQFHKSIYVINFISPYSSPKGKS